MLETTIYEMKKSWKRDSAIGVAMGLMGALMVGIYPSFESSMDLTELINSMPEALQSVFGAASINSLEGFLALEMYGIFWLALLGAYFAYRGGGLISGEIESGKIDNTLLMPVTRTKFILEKYLSLITPIITLNLAVILFEIGTAMIMGLNLSVQNLLLTHLLSVPYFFACGNIGLLFSTLLERESSGRRISAGLMFGLFMVEKVTKGTDFEAIGIISPTKYYEASNTLIEGTVNLADTGLLIGATVLLLLVSVMIFRQRDL